MRSDIAKVIVETPRAGDRSRKYTGEKKELRDTENLPKKQSMRQKWRKLGYDAKYKNLTDYLNPLRRYLRKQVGRNWNDVWSEICENLPMDSAQSGHVRDHVVNDFVELHVDMIDGKPYRKTGYKWSGDPIEITSYRREQFYVHPDTNILCLAPKETYKQKKNQSTLVWEDDTHVNVEIEGVFYEITVKPYHLVDRGYWKYPYDCVQKDSIDEYRAVRLYGKAVVGVSKRQLNKSEIRKRGLRAS